MISTIILCREPSLQILNIFISVFVSLPVCQPEKKLFLYCFLFSCRMFSYGEFKAEDQVIKLLSYVPIFKH